MKTRVILIISFLILLLPLSLPARDFRVGLMPAKESLPFYAEERLGVFRKHGINLVLIPFRSALERDSAFEAGKIDGAINDLVGTALLAKHGRNIKILRTIAKPGKDYPVFMVMKSGTATARPDIAVSYNTVIEYVTDRVLEREKPGEALKKTEIKSVPLRMQLLLEGKVGYATLAEPLASYAAMKGAKEAYRDTGVKGGHVLFVARGDLGEDFLRIVLAAYDEMCLEVNRGKARLKDLLWARLSLPPELKDSYALPDLPVKALPQKDDLQDVLSWMQRKGLLKEPVDYEKLVYR